MSEIKEENLGLFIPRPSLWKDKQSSHRSQSESTKICCFEAEEWTPASAAAANSWRTFAKKCINKRIKGVSWFTFPKISSSFLRDTEIAQEIEVERKNRTRFDFVSDLFLVVLELLHDWRDEVAWGNGCGAGNAVFGERKKHLKHYAYEFFVSDNERPQTEKLNESLLWSSYRERTSMKLVWRRWFATFPFEEKFLQILKMEIKLRPM